MNAGQGRTPSFMPWKMGMIGSDFGKAMDAAKAAGFPVVVIQKVLPEGAPFVARGTNGAELHATVSSRGSDHYVLKIFPTPLRHRPGT